MPSTWAQTVEEAVLTCGTSYSFLYCFLDSSIFFILRGLARLVDLRLPTLQTVCVPALSA